MASERVSLAQCAKFIVDNRGKTCPVGDEGTPLIATNCLRSGDLYPTKDTTRFVSEHVYSTWFRAHPLPGDIIFVTKGAPGRVCLAPNPVDFCIAQDMVAIRADEKVVDPLFLFAALRLPATLKAIDDLHVGTMIPHFKKGDFDKLIFELPERQVQESVGRLHFSLCERIDLFRQTNATLEAIAQALFKSWFVDFDPVRAKAEGRDPEGMDPAAAALFQSEFEVSELGVIPKGWFAGTLGDLSDLNASKWTTKKHPGWLSYLDLSGVNENRIDPPTEYRFDDAPSRARHHLRDGDTIVGTVRPGNRAFAFISEPAPTLTGSTGFAVLSPKSPHLSSFVYLAATRGEAIERLANLADGGAYPAVRPSVVAATPCVVPQPEILQAFADITQPLLNRVARNGLKIRTLSEIRDTLLPRLISGKLRLPEAEEAINEVAA